MAMAADILAVHPFCKGLAPQLVERLAALAEPYACAADAYLFQTGDSASHCYLLTAGAVMVEAYDPVDGPVLLQTVPEPEVVGWSWLVPPHTWTFDARARGEVTAIALDATALRAAFEVDHELGYQLLLRFAHVFSERLLAARLQLLDSAKSSLPRRASG